MVHILVDGLAHQMSHYHSSEPKQPEVLMSFSDRAFRSFVKDLAGYLAYRTRQGTIVPPEEIHP